eukprot:284816140_2
MRCTPRTSEVLIKLLMLLRIGYLTLLLLSLRFPLSRAKQQGSSGSWTSFLLIAISKRSMKLKGSLPRRHHHRRELLISAGVNLPSNLLQSKVSYSKLILWPIFQIVALVLLRSLNSVDGHVRVLLSGGYTKPPGARVGVVIPHWWVLWTRADQYFEIESRITTTAGGPSHVQCSYEAFCIIYIGISHKKQILILEQTTPVISLGLLEGKEPIPEGSWLLACRGPVNTSLEQLKAPCRGVQCGIIHIPGKIGHSISCAAHHIPHAIQNF